MRWRLNRQPPSPEEKVVETMSMPRASIFAFTGKNLTSINIMTKPKVEKKEEKTSITISRPTTGKKIWSLVKANLNSHLNSKPPGGGEEGEVLPVRGVEARQGGAGEGGEAAEDGGGLLSRGPRLGHCARI